MELKIQIRIKIDASEEVMKTDGDLIISEAYRNAAAKILMEKWESSVGKYARNGNTAITTTEIEFTKQNQVKTDGKTNPEDDKDKKVKELWEQIFKSTFPLGKDQPYGITDFLEKIHIPVKKEKPALSESEKDELISDMLQKSIRAVVPKSFLMLEFDGLVPKKPQDLKKKQKLSEILTMAHTALMMEGNPEDLETAGKLRELIFKYADR